MPLAALGSFQVAATLLDIGVVSLGWQDALLNRDTLSSLVALAFNLRATVRHGLYKVSLRNNHAHSPGEVRSVCASHWQPSGVPTDRKSVV